MVATTRRSWSNPKFWFCNFPKALVSRPDADSKTSASADWATTRVFLGSEPARAVDRPAPRRASIGSTRVVIHAGAMPKATPVKSEVTVANSSTGMDGDASIGTPANPGNEGNAKWRMRRVPAKAIARPAMPPNNESRMLSVRACRTTRDARAPSAILNDVCRRRSKPRVVRSEEHTSELQSRLHLVCRLLLEKKKKNKTHLLHLYQHSAPTSITTTQLNHIQHTSLYVTTIDYTRTILSTTASSICVTETSASV